MSRFLTPLRTEDQSAQVGHIRFVLLEPLVYESNILYAIGVPAGRIVIPARMSTDFLSVPQFLQNIFPAVGEYDEGAVLHDHVYQTGLFSRRIGDALLLEAMGCAVRPTWKRYPIYEGVHLFGWVVWNDYRKTQQAHV